MTKKQFLESLRGKPVHVDFMEDDNLSQVEGYLDFTIDPEDPDNIALEIMSNKGYQKIDMSEVKKIYVKG
ncbi:hypothetical protein GOV14_05840 [Candidatus Pacearchaeota archaeon]|nr:hypothetical protein [Candidatus Pacearchaeota archaeon]